MDLDLLRHSLRDAGVRPRTSAASAANAIVAPAAAFVYLVKKSKRVEVSA